MRWRGGAEARDAAAKNAAACMTAFLTPFRSGMERNIRMAGPRLTLSPKNAQAFALLLHELATNAAKYGGLDSTVVVKAERGAHEVIVRVLDDGPGIDMDERERLFELILARASVSIAIASRARIDRARSGSMADR